MAELEPVLRVVVTEAPDSAMHMITVEGVELPVRYRSRSEALRIADRLYSLLVEGFETRWAALLEARAAWVRQT